MEDFDLGDDEDASEELLLDESQDRLDPAEDEGLNEPEEMEAEPHEGPEHAPAEKPHEGHEQVVVAEPHESHEPAPAAAEPHDEQEVIAEPHEQSCRLPCMQAPILDTTAGPMLWQRPVQSYMEQMSLGSETRSPRLAEHELSFNKCFHSWLRLEILPAAFCRRLCG